MNRQYDHALPVWWSFLWRSAAYGIFANFLIRLAAYFIGKSGVIDLQGAMSIANIITAICYLPISYLAMRQALSRHAVASDA